MKSWDQPSASSRVVRIVEGSKNFNHPRRTSSRSSEALDIDEILEKICDGTQEIVSPKGSSQYGDKLGKRISASTCGLAALNFARIAFKLEKEENMQGLELLSELLSPQTIEVGALHFIWECTHTVILRKLPPFVIIGRAILTWRSKSS